MAEAAKAGPTIAQGVTELHAVFSDDAALQDAVGRLGQAGFDRADLSLPDIRPDAPQALPEGGAEAVTTETDMRQARTLGTGLTASAAGMAAAGAVIATGGAAAVAIGAAAAAGLGAGALSDAVGKAAEGSGRAARSQSAARGELVLSIRASDPSRQQVARHLAEAAGAVRVETVHREGGDVRPLKE